MILCYILHCCFSGQYQCQLCHKNFGYKNGLVRHIRLTHIGEKPYECSVCHRRFGYKHILSEHMNLHSGHRPYECTMCDKKFAARSNLIQHRSVHKRPYQCSKCNKRFDKEDQLKKHMFTHPETTLQCNLCNKSCNNASELKKHITKTHPLELAQQQQQQMLLSNVKPEPLLSQQPATQNGGGGGAAGMLDDMSSPHAMSPLTNSPHSILPIPGAHLLHQQQAATAGIALSQHTTEPISPPAGASPDGHAQAPPQTPPPVAPPGHTTPPARAPAMMNERGQRIDAICSQLVTSISNPMPPESHTPPATHYKDSSIKKEDQSPRFSGGDAHQQDHSQSPRVASTGSADYQQHYTTQDLAQASIAAMSNQMMVDDIPPKEEISTSTLPGIEMFSRRPATQKLPQFNSFASGNSTPPLLPTNDMRAMNIPNDLPLNLMSPQALASAAAAVASDALAGFPSGCSSPPLATGLNAAASRSNSNLSTASIPHQQQIQQQIQQQQQQQQQLQHQQLQQLHQHQHQQALAAAAAAEASPHRSNSIPPSPIINHMPVTPQPPQTPTQQTLPTPTSTHDQAIQHSTPTAPNFPNLHDIINYYVQQGTIYKCEHCDIVFFERGMFFLHASLHNRDNPWECSVCNKVCVDRNEFTLHLVNQPHSNA